MNAVYFYTAFFGAKNGGKKREEIETEYEKTNHIFDHNTLTNGDGLSNQLG